MNKHFKHDQRIEKEKNGEKIAHEQVIESYENIGGRNNEEQQERFHSKRSK